MAIIEISYNWRSCANGAERYEIARVGHQGVTKITEHSACGEGDRWFYDIWFKAGFRKRVFNPSEVIIDNQIIGGENS